MLLSECEPDHNPEKKVLEAYSLSPESLLREGISNVDGREAATVHEAEDS
ncbi:MAG TPA: hypothetical protein VMM54_02585 [Nitrospirota bacterium]|nr:hypothetical protein [Nitrospirota bacterium]